MSNYIMVAHPIAAPADRAVASARFCRHPSVITCRWRCSSVCVHDRQHPQRQHRRGGRYPQCSPVARASRVQESPQAGPGSIGSVVPITLQQASAQQLDEQRQRLAQQITTWLDDEWLPQDVHRDLGDAAAEAYARQRKQGEADMASILLAVIGDLQAFGFRETFTDPFEVANKVAELVMISEGHEVGGCCVPGDAAER